MMSMNMRRATAIFCAAILLAPGAAWADRETVLNSLNEPLPYREAFMMEASATAAEAPIAIGVEGLPEPVVKRVFGGDPDDTEVYLVAITNNTAGPQGLRVLVQSLYMVKDDEIMPLPDWNEAIQVMDVDTSVFSGRNGQIMREEVARENIARKAFHPGVLEPGQTLLGAIFLDEDVADRRDRPDLEVLVQNLGGLAYLTVRVPLPEPAED